MRLAARIQRIRLQRSVTLEELEAKTNLPKRLMARLEKGQEVPTLAMLDALADALDVPVHRFFYDDGEPALTPRLTTRLTLRELAEEYPGPANQKGAFGAAIKAWSGLAVRAVTRDRLLVRLRSQGANRQRDSQGSDCGNAEGPDDEG